MQHLLKAVVTVERIDTREALSKLSAWSKTINKNFMQSARPRR